MEAMACTQEAANLFPCPTTPSYMRGQVAELRGNVDEARRWYEEAGPSAHPRGRSMQRLVSGGCPSAAAGAPSCGGHAGGGLGRQTRPAWAPGLTEGRVWVRGPGQPA